jgi:hypothetical protein
LEALDYTSKRDTLIQIFKEVHRDIAVHFDLARPTRYEAFSPLVVKLFIFLDMEFPRVYVVKMGKVDYK